jgi:hypothetical protein
MGGMSRVLLSDTTPKIICVDDAPRVQLKHYAFLYNVHDRYGFMVVVLNSSIRRMTGMDGSPSHFDAVISIFSPIFLSVSWWSSTNRPT